MKYLTLLLALLALAAGPSMAQIVEPVHWQTTTETDGATLTVHFVAQIDPTYHLYATDIADGGPQKTEMVYEVLTGAEPDGPVTLSAGRRVEHHDAAFGMLLGYYERGATFSQRFRLTDDTWRIEGYVYYMACNDQQCTPPTRYEFALSGSAPSAATSKPGTGNHSSPAAGAGLTSGNGTSPAGGAGQESGTEATPAAGAGLTSGNGTPPAAPSEGVPGASDDPAGAGAQPGAAPASLSADALWAPVIDQLNAYGAGTGDFTGQSHAWWYILLAGFLAGLVALVTPCVWPMIPMTVSFFLKRTKDRRKSTRDACTYGLAIIVIYVVLGLAVTAVFGASALNSLATNAVFNLIFFALLVVFALSFFGAFDLTLPSSWTTRLDAKADATTGLLSIFFMAFTLCLVSFSCTGPIIGTLLVEAATSGSMLHPAIGMLGFAIALSLPFSLFALFPSMLSAMPRSGGWLGMVKVVLGFGELALSLKFLSVADLAYGWGLLDRETFLCLWIVIFALLGVYLLGFIRLPHDDDPAPTDRVSVTRLMLSMASLSFALYMVPGLWGAPCKAISAFAPPMSTQDFLLGERPLTTYHDYQAGMEAAARLGRPVLVDFSGYGCVNCRKMEAAVWSDPAVHDIIERDYVVIELMVDDKTALPEPVTVSEGGRDVRLRTVGDRWSYLQRYKFGANAQPFYVLLDAAGRPLAGSYSYDEDVDAYVGFLQTGLRNFRR